MENTRVVVVCVFLIAAAATPQFAFSYSRETHKGLTEAVIRAYENMRGDTFGAEEEVRMVQGSSDEDDEIRFLRHFYDPTKNEGLFGRFLASKYWAQDTLAQGNYRCLGFSEKLCVGSRIEFHDKLFSSPTDFSWDRAVYEYAYGDKARAAEALGHVLHLIEDATVPAHVRDDDHALGDPYESFSERYGEGDVEVPRGLAPPAFPGLGHAFDAVAWFANKNFVSKDTLFNEYDSPSLENMVMQGGYVFHPVFKHKIARIEERVNRTPTYFSVDTEVHVDDENNTVAADYWRVLSRRAIESGVGVIDLFFREVEEEKRTGRLLAMNTSAAERRVKETALRGFGVVKTLYGSSLTQSDVEELLNEGQASSAAFAFSTAPEPQEPAASVDVQIPPPSDVPEDPIPETLAEPVSSSLVQEPEETEGEARAEESRVQIFSGGGGSPTPRESAAAVVSTTTVSLATPAQPSVSECSLSLSSSSCLIPTTAAHVTWTDTQGAASYGVSLGGLEPTATVTGTSTTVLLSTGANSLSVVAFDGSGGRATSTSVSVEVNTLPLTIHEIGWAGTDSDSSAQWIELKKSVSDTLNLSRIAIAAADGSPYIQLSGSFETDMSATDDNILLVKYGASASTAGGVHTLPFDSLSGSGEELSVVWWSGYGTTTLDATPAVATCGGWCEGGSLAIGGSVQFGTSTHALSMERIDSGTDGTLASSWRDNDMYTTSGNSGEWGTPGKGNSTGLGASGWFCAPSTTSISSGANYAPASGATCTWLSRFINLQAKRNGALYKGVVGTSTFVGEFGSGLWLLGAKAAAAPSGASAGETFFAAIWEIRNSVVYDDATDFDSYFRIGSPSTPPHSNYSIIPWTYGP